MEMCILISPRIRNQQKNKHKTSDYLG